MPYGTKSLATVERYAIENSQFLDSRGIKLLVVACNTASALALPEIRANIGVEVIGVIGPGARKAVEITATEKPRIAVIATEATVRAMLTPIRYKIGNGGNFQSACPLFVPLAEENWTQESETFSIAKKYLTKINEFEPEALVLGCTHYPILREVIQQTVGADVTFIDSGEACAEEVEKLLDEKISPIRTKSRASEIFATTSIIFTSPTRRKVSPASPKDF